MNRQVQIQGKLRNEDLRIARQVGQVGHQHNGLPRPATEFLTTAQLCHYPTEYQYVYREMEVHSSCIARKFMTEHVTVNT